LPQGLPLRPQLLGLDWTRAEAALEWGQGQARQYQQTRRPLSAQPVRGWRARRHSLCQDPRHRASAVAHGIASTTAEQGCAIALANKIARMVWVLMARGERYKEPSRLRRKRD